MKDIDLGIESECMTIRRSMDGINEELKKIRKVLSPMDKGAGVQYIDDTLKGLIIDMVNDGIPQAVIADKLGIPRSSTRRIIFNQKKVPN